MDSNEQGKNQVSRRSLLRTGAVTGVVAAAAAGGSFAAAGTASAATGHGGGSHRETSPAGDLILFNGRIHTVDRRGSVASVIAIRGGVIVYLGESLQAARQQFSSAPQAIDLAGKVAVPGLIDCHNHFVLMGNRPGHHTPLENAYSVADVQALYRQRARAHLPQEPEAADQCRQLHHHDRRLHPESVQGGAASYPGRA
jgi:imidazolonepropionase-like amidohydrolase